MTKKVILMSLLVSILFLSSCTKEVYIEPIKVKMYQFPIKKKSWDKLEIEYEIYEDED